MSLRTCGRFESKLEKPCRRGCSSVVEPWKCVTFHPSSVAQNKTNTTNKATHGHSLLDLNTVVTILMILSTHSLYSDLLQSPGALCSHIVRSGDPYIEGGDNSWTMFSGRLARVKEQGNFLSPRVSWVLLTVPTLHKRHKQTETARPQETGVKQVMKKAEKISMDC